MKTHELKIWTEHIEALASKRKTFEIRSTADRAFEAGDLLLLNEYLPEDKVYTGRQVRAVVSMVHSEVPGLEKGFVLLSLAEVTKTGKQWVEIGAESVNRLTPEDEKALEDWIPKKMPLILVRKAEKRLGVVENHALDTAAYVKAGNSNIPTPSTPAGWLRLEPGALTLPGEQTRIWNDAWQIEGISGGQRYTVNRMVIVPSRLVPWGEGYMAVLFDEHMEDDEGYLPESQTNAAGWYKMSCVLPKRRSEVPIRRKLKRLRGAEGLAEKVQEIQGSKP